MQTYFQLNPCGSKHQRILNQNTSHFLKENVHENVVCKVAASLFRSQSVNLVIITLADYLGRTHQKRVNMFRDPLINYVIQYPLCFESPPGFPSGEYSLYDFMMPVIKLQTLENNEIAVNVADDIAKKLTGALLGQAWSRGPARSKT